MTNPSQIHIRNPEESGFCPGLYLVPTPIGNLRDMTLRALDILTACDVLVCEDARVTGKLLKAYGITVPEKITYNDHADEAVKSRIVKTLRAGKIVAMVSDAGTPMISDPGYKLVQACLADGIYVTALPGANAVLPALQLSGLPSDSFAFLGFLPAKDKALQDFLERQKARADTWLVYESPKRLVKTLAVMAQIMPDRPVAVSREISKLYEETLRGTASAILAQIGDKQVKGEIVIAVKGASDQGQAADPDALIRAALKTGESIKDLSARLAGETGLKKKQIYDRALALSQKNA